MNNTVNRYSDSRWKRSNNVQPVEQTEQVETYYSKIAKFAFVVFLFFAFFGTSTPFQPKVTDAQDIGTSNVVNQLLYVSLFFMTLISLYPKLSNLYILIKNEIFLFSFLGFCLLSIYWSDYSFVSFKRFFQIFTATLVITSFLLHTTNTTERIKYFKYILYTYLLLSIIVVFIVPGAKDPDFGTWRGFASTKNVLGQIMIISLILSVIAYKYTEGKKGKRIAGIMIFLSVVLLIGTASSTTIITFLIISGMAFLLYSDKIFQPIGIGRAFSFLLSFTFVIIILSITIFEPDLWKIIPQVAGKDITFSGRTDLWADMFLEIEKHFWLGTGYQGYWVVDSPSIEKLYEIYVWLPNEAHNGYIDILNEVGIIGLLLFGLVIISYFYKAFKYDVPKAWSWLIFAALIFNIQESTFFIPGILLGLMFIYAYLAFQVDILQHKNVIE